MQTDKTQTRSCWWNITEHREDSIKYLEAGDYPSWVKAVYGGREEAPTTGKLHYQGCIHTSQVRFSQMRKWLNGAHIEKCYDIEASQRYAMKDETAIGKKEKILNKNRYYSMEDAMKLLGKIYLSYDKDKLVKYEYKHGRSNYSTSNGVVVPAYKDNYWILVRSILREQPHLASLLSNPQTFRLWENTWQVWVESSV